MLKIGDYFSAFAAKKLSVVDIDATRSRQSEIGGTDGFRAMFGTPPGKEYYDGKYVYLDDDTFEAAEIVDAGLTWYDTRRLTARSAEYRLLYRKEARPVLSRARPGDTLFVAQRDERVVYMIFAKAGSSILRQLEWIFLPPSDRLVKAGRGKETLAVAIGPGKETQPDLEPLALEELLGMLGIEVDLSDDKLLRRILKKFGEQEWPSTQELAAFARRQVRHADAVGDPDETLMRWVEMEHRIFRTLEKHRISEQISRGFHRAEGGVDVDAFLKMSLSVNNRRKSRAGLSLEQHLEAIFQANGILFVKKAKTEGKKEPDFLFPSKAAYDDSSFPMSLLTMLGSKTTLKDRWRQVLNEADRIPNKHLLTLQPAISEDQTAEMRAERLQLVIPAGLHSQGFTREQQEWLIGLKDFIGEVRHRGALAPPVAGALF